MSEENVKLVRSAFAAWNAGDTERFLGFFSEDVVFSTSGVFPDLDPVYRGRPALKRFYDEMLSAWEYFHIEPRDIEVNGDVLITTLRFEGKGRSSGVEVALDFFHGSRVENGELIYAAARPSAEEALEAAAGRLE